MRFKNTRLFMLQNAMRPREAKRRRRHSIETQHAITSRNMRNANRSIRVMKPMLMTCQLRVRVFLSLLASFSRTHVCNWRYFGIEVDTRLISFCLVGFFHHQAGNLLRNSSLHSGKRGKLDLYLFIAWFGVKILGNTLYKLFWNYFIALGRLNLKIFVEIN